MKTAKKRVSKKPKTTKSRVVWGIIDSDGDFQIHSKKPSTDSPTALAHVLVSLNSYLKWFCRADARKFFDLRGMKTMEPWKFRITTERLP